MTNEAKIDLRDYRPNRRAWGFGSLELDQLARFIAFLSGDTVWGLTDLDLLFVLTRIGANDQISAIESKPTRNQVYPS